MPYRQIARVHALRLHLRGQDAWHDVARILPQADIERMRGQPNRPLFLMKRQGQTICDAMARGIFQGFDAFQLEGQLAALALQRAICERIAHITVPRRYDCFARVPVRIFTIVMPCFLIKTLAADGVDWPVIPPAGVIALLFTTIERTGAVNEEPFENRITAVGGVPRDRARPAGTPR